MKTITAEEKAITATEVEQWQKSAMEDLQTMIEEEIRKTSQQTSQRTISDYVSEMAHCYTLQRKAQQLTDELMVANPEYTEYTKQLAKLILESHPKLNKHGHAYEVILPYVLNVAHELESQLEKLLPEAWRNGNG